ncbi:MAG: hypothetical protein ACJ796_22370 [Gemmatimonadaceae bacterium]
MSISRRTLARAGMLAIGALTFAGCGGDSATAPLPITTDQLQSMGSSVATELEGAIGQLTAQDVMNSNGGAPSFSRVPHATVQMFRGLSMDRYALSRTATDISQCGVASQTPPVDTDGDQVPDNFSVTFALPACHFADATSNYDVTGVLRISDPQPGTAGLALSYGLENFKVTFSGANGSGYISRDGSGSVSVSTGGLSQTVNWTDLAVLTGVTSASDVLHWTATFAAVQGQSLVAGRALPDGVYQPNGSVTLSEGRRSASFTVTTIDPLQYSASCAAGVTQGTSMTPFTAGRVRVSVTNQQNSGSVDVTYASCNTATVTLSTQ